MLAVLLYLLYKTLYLITVQHALQERLLESLTGSRELLQSPSNVRTKHQKPVYQHLWERLPGRESLQTQRKTAEDELGLYWCETALLQGFNVPMVPPSKRSNKLLVLLTAAS